MPISNARVDWACTWSVATQMQNLRSLIVQKAVVSEEFAVDADLDHWISWGNECYLVLNASILTARSEEMPVSIVPHAINAPDVVAEDFDGQVVILNLANGHYFSLEGCAGDIWALILAGHAPDTILSSIGAAEPAIYEPSVAFLQRLIRLELVRPDEFSGENEEAISTLWSNNPPHLEIYSDLAELIYADPIHDVDEQAGWPKPRENQ